MSDQSSPRMRWQRWCVLLGVALAACRTYEPSPLAPQDHLAAWKARAPDEASARAFSERPADGPAEGAFDPDDGIDLNEGVAIALVHNSGLRALRATSAVAETLARGSGRWKDPVLGVDAERISESVASPWVLGAQLGLTIPALGRSEAEIASATATWRAELAHVATQEWNTIVQLRSDWARWSADRLRLRTQAAFSSELARIRAVMERIAAAGEMDRLQLRLFEALALAQSTELDALTARIANAEFALKQSMGLHADAPWKLNPREVWDAIPMADSESATLERNLQIELQRRRYEVAEQELRLEIHRQYPDLTLAPGIGTDEGTSRGLLSFSLPLPLWNRNGPAIDAADAKRALARAEYETVLETTLAAVAQAQRQLAATQAVRVRVQRELVPLAEAQQTDLSRMVALGRFDALTALPVLQSGFEIRERDISARLDEWLAMIELDGIVGPRAKTSPDRTQPTQGAH